MQTSEHVSEAAIHVLRLAGDAELTQPDLQREALATIEGGGLLFLPGRHFELTDRERELISDPSRILVKQPEVKNGRPTVVYEPQRRRIKRNYAKVKGRLVRALVREEARPELEAMLERFSQWADDVVDALFPSYRDALVRDRVTYRPNERTGAQPLHVDSSYGHPTHGQGMLRIFCNVDPLQRPRVWQVGEPFESFAKRFLPQIHLRGSTLRTLLGHLGVVRGAPIAYDRMIAELRRVAKRDKVYQDTAPRQILEFPSGSCWCGITDLVLHGALSGQHSLDRTYFLPAEAMRDPSLSSLHILERLSGRTLQ